MKLPVDPAPPEETPQQVQAEDVGVNVPFQIGTFEDRVCIVFEQPVKTMRFSPGKARRLAQSLIRSANHLKANK